MFSEGLRVKKVLVDWDWVKSFVGYIVDWIRLLEIRIFGGKSLMDCLVVRRGRAMGLLILLF